MPNLKIKLLANYLVRGPGKVFNNLKTGLENLGHTVVDSGQDCDYCVCLQNPVDWPDDHIDIVGPNTFTVPDQMPSICQQYNNFLVPSKWVKDCYEKYACMKNNQCHIWPVGIETATWDPEVLPKNEQHFDCLIYYKNADKKYLQKAVDLCNSLSLSYAILGYGNYDESILKIAAGTCKFCILCTKTESQGIAYMEILSSNIPCFVFEKTEWDDMPGHECSASAAPYFDDICGVKVNRDADLTEMKKHFKIFVNTKYEPRKYILDHHTLETSANTLLNILEKIK